MNGNEHNNPEGPGISSDLLQWSAAKGIAGELESRRHIKIEAGLIMLQLPGLYDSLLETGESGLLPLLETVHSALENAFSGELVCELSRMGEDFLFLVDGEAGSLAGVARSLFAHMSQAVSSADTRGSLNPRIASSIQPVRIVSFANRGAALCLPSCPDYLQALLEEGRACRARLILGERCAGDALLNADCRLIGMRSAGDEYGARGIYEDLHTYPEYEGRILRVNRRLTDRGISAFHAGLLAESRKLFFDALEKAPFDPLPGRYLNLIQHQG